MGTMDIDAVIVLIDKLIKASLFAGGDAGGPYGDAEDVADERADLIAAIRGEAALVRDDLGHVPGCPQRRWAKPGCGCVRSMTILEMKCLPVEERHVEVTGGLGSRDFPLRKGGPSCCAACGRDWPCPDAITLLDPDR